MNELSRPKKTEQPSFERNFNRLRNNINPPQLIMAVFFGLILVGTILLSMPFSSKDGHTVGVLNALFTSVSAVCVNGLTVVDTASTYTMFGQVVIMMLIQIGGIGFMTVGVMVAILLGKKIGLKQRLIIQQTTQSTTAQGLVKLSLYMALIVFIFESIATLILTLHWQGDMGLGRAAYYALFHSISAFNNAGFSLWPESLTQFAADPVVNLTIMSLFIIGGLGYIVILDVIRKRSWRKLSLHSKVVLLSTAILIAAGFLLILLLESLNGATLGGMPFGERILAALFQSTTPRSVGFNTIEVGSMLAVSQFILIILMFIGAGSGGTGGGIKVNTLVILTLATIQTFRGGGQIHAFERKVSQETVMRALAVVMTALAFVLTVTLVLTVTEDVAEDNFLAVLFEATSAFSTTGLSLGVTGELSTAGKIVVTITMFLGRLGPLTLAYALAQKKQNSKIGYPEDHILVG